MSNCHVHSLFEGHGDKASLTKLILAGASYVDVSKAFLHVATSSLSFLDLSNSNFDGFCLLSHMYALEHLDLSATLIDDNSVEIIACIGAKLRSLILDGTGVTAAGVGILAGNVPTLQNISLSRTPADDLAISYISMIPSLKVINLSKTNVNGMTLPPVLELLLHFIDLLISTISNLESTTPHILPYIPCFSDHYPACLQGGS